MQKNIVLKTRFLAILFLMVGGSFSVLADKASISPASPPRLTSPQPPFTASLSRFGTPKYKPGFTAFSYVNPDAPKGGKLKMGTIGTFDSLNDYVAHGTPAFNCFMLTMDPLMRRSIDEPLTLYGLIAQKVELAPDYSSITFYLNPMARFHDGTSITAEDVKFSYEMLREKGLPRYRQFYGKISTMEILNEHAIKLTFQKTDTGYDPEIPLTVAQLRVFSKASLADKDFRETGLTPLLSSGPYKITQVEAGRYIVYERVKDYWAADLPVNRGMYNFDIIKIDYYKTAQAQFQAFKAGEFDVFFEVDSQQWRKGYNIPAVTSGKIKKVSFKINRPVSVRTALFNMRRPLFQDIRVREAIAFAFDWDTMSKMLCDGDYQRVDSLFANTSLAHKGAAQGLELALLQPYLNTIPQEILEKGYHPPRTKGDGDARRNLEAASKLLDEAGFLFQKDKHNQQKAKYRFHTKTGQPLVFEFMYKDQRIEKFLNHFRINLEKIGVILQPRFVDTVQYEARVMESDFDMIGHIWSNGASPGNEQVYYFSQKTADQKGSSNYIGVKDPVLEALAHNVANAKTAEEQLAAVHALDRVFMGRHYTVPMFYDNTIYWAYWVDRVDFPPFDPAVGTNTLEWWWAKPAGQPDYADHSPSDPRPSLFRRFINWWKGLKS